MPRSVFDENVLKMMGLSVRVPHQNWGDLNAQIASKSIGISQSEGDRGAVWQGAVPPRYGRFDGLYRGDRVTVRGIFTNRLRRQPDAILVNLDFLRSADARGAVVAAILYVRMSAVS
ncbi:MAG: hypothetical protein ACXWLB_05005 [Reyranella sp.]